MATLSLSIGSFEAIVRPNVTLQSHLRDRTPAPVEVPEEEAEIRWGKPSSFQWSTTNPPSGTGGGGVVVRPNPDDEEEPGAPVTKTVIFDEIAASTETEDVRVENPEDSEQYVIEQRCLSVPFLAPQELTDALIGLRDGTISTLIFQLVLHPEQRPGNSGN